MKNRMSFSTGTIVIFIILGLLIALQLKSLNLSNLQNNYSKQDLTKLKEDVMTILLENETLSEENQGLSDLISSMGEELAGDDLSLQAIIDEKRKAEVFAGLTDVSGTGINIVMDASTDLPNKASSLLLIVNELRSTGALAICINEDRVVAMTEIRDTGSTDPQIVINGNSYPAKSQFVIKAIYNQDDINRGLQLVNHVVEQLDLEGLVTVSTVESVSIPKLSENSLGNTMNQ
jgi:uncharacterized protein YlxW (UPF0749 family)